MFVAPDKVKDFQYLKILTEASSRWSKELGETVEKANQSTIELRTTILYAVQLISKLDSIISLLENGKYDSVYLIARCYVEHYAILEHLVSDSTFFRRIIISDMIQEKQIMDTVEDVNQSGYYDRFKNYFDNYLNYSYDKNNFEQELNTFLQQNRNQKILMADTVRESIERNKYISQQNVDSKFIYSYLCSISHSNISAMDDRSKSYNGIVGINTNCVNLKPLVEVVAACFNDIVDKMKTL